MNLTYWLNEAISALVIPDEKTEQHAKSIDAVRVGPTPAIDDSAWLARIRAVADPKKRRREAMIIAKEAFPLDEGAQIVMAHRLRRKLRGNSRHTIRAKKVRRLRLDKNGRESFDAFEIFCRDNWVCRLCSEKVDIDLVHPHPMSATLDHIIPVAMGGSHTRENTQCAHLKCNNKKGARVAIS